MRLRVITKDKNFLDFNIKVPIYLSTTDLSDKFAVMIVEENEIMLTGGEKIMKCTGCGAKIEGTPKVANNTILCNPCYKIVSRCNLMSENINNKDWSKIRARAKANNYAIPLTGKDGKVELVEPGCV